MSHNSFNTILCRLKSGPEYVQKEFLRGFRDYRDRYKLDWRVLFGTSALVKWRLGELHPSALVTGQHSIVRPATPGGRRPCVPLIWCGDPARCPADGTAVWFDDDAIGRLAADYLLSRGVRHFACQRRKRRGRTEPYRRRREDAFIDRLRRHGFSCFESPEATGDTLQNVAQLHGWLRSLPPGSAIFCYVSNIAAHLCEDLTDLGAQPGTDIMVVSAGVPELLREPIICVRCSWFQLGFEAARATHVVLCGNQPAPKPVPPFGVFEPPCFRAKITDPWLRNLLREVRRHPRSSWKVAGLATRLGVSHQTLIRKLRARTGKRPRDWLRAVRLELAQAALRDDPQATIQAIAVRLGWCDGAHLARDFRAGYGVTPTRFREAVGPG